MTLFTCNLGFIPTPLFYSNSLLHLIVGRMASQKLHEYLD
jgi:hypothetical protein